MTPNTEQRNDAVRDKIRPSSEIPAAIELWFFRDLGDTQRRQLINWCGIPGVSANGEDFQRECLSAILSALSQPPAPSPLEGEVRHAADELAAFATLLERPPLDDVEIEEKLAVRITKSIRTILSALSTEAGSGRHPCPDILREDHNEAVDWITANCMATRRDNGNMDYSLGAMIAAYEAGKKATAEAGKPAGEESVKRIEDGHADTEGEAAGPLCRWRRNARLL